MNKTSQRSNNGDSVPVSIQRIIRETPNCTFGILKKKLEESGIIYKTNRGLLKQLTPLLESKQVIKDHTGKKPIYKLSNKSKYMQAYEGYQFRNTMTTVLTSKHFENKPKELVTLLGEYLIYAVSKNNKTEHWNNNALNFSNKHDVVLYNIKSMIQDKRLHLEDVIRSNTLRNIKEVEKFLEKDPEYAKIPTDGLRDAVVFSE